jgi:2-methylisocitrate lyase-like PEP mutase family enzyme
MTDIAAQQLLATSFREMHRGGKVLLLPNVWDVASARLVEEAGFPALATTSAGIAFSVGYPDGQRISREQMLARVGRIVRAVEVPVSADMEAGYGSRPEDAARTAAGVIEAGAVGLNLEDGSSDPARPLVDRILAVEKIRAVREAALKAGVWLVLNARTDVYLREAVAPELRYGEAIERARAYRDAGADCVFVPGLRDPETISRLVREVECAVNILAGPGFLPVPELEKLGVARVSLGSGVMRATLGLLRRVTEELKTSGTYRALEDAPSHAEVGQLFN